MAGQIKEIASGVHKRDIFLAEEVGGGAEPACIRTADPRGQQGGGGSLEGHPHDAAVFVAGQDWMDNREIRILGQIGPQPADAVAADDMIAVHEAVKSFNGCPVAAEDYA